MRITGKGEPIVFLHGYLSSSHYFRKMRRRLGKTHQIITIDLLGFGQSPKPESGYSYEDHVMAVHRSIRALNLTVPPTIIGHSTGALIALRYTTTHPNQVKNLQLFNPPMFTDTKQAVDIYKASGGHYRIMLLSKWRRRYWRLLGLMPRNLSRMRSEINLADILRASRMAREGTFQNVIVASKFFSDLERVTHDTLLVIGKYDRQIYRDNMQSHPIPANVTVQLVKTAHHTLVRAPRLSERLIRAHLLQ